MSGDRVMVRGVVRFAAGVLVMLGIIQAATVFQAWHRAERELSALDRLWLALLPVWLFVFFRYFSIFRKDCPACLGMAAPEQAETHGGEGTPVAGPARLAPCPPSPNCVSSLAPDAAHRVAALPCGVGRAQAIAIIAEALGGLPRARIAERADGYLRAEFTSRLLRFVDDVEFSVDEPGGCVHVRSAARVGYWDLGVNRRRVEAIRRLAAGRLAP